ncbi:hypothetical protein OH76DRAFT_1480706 [Lentinus brumalis]|uniref:Uncharacterized protein n=1 Tax=Lentinus brumalis TaxID=2498619 RepID=A0A371DJ93_9APHY|nr:hypothetical protein OH76DRAFT_1480706 [Polyporus brumalis]
MSEAYMPAKPVVALNTIHSIAVDGLACCNDGTPTKIEIKRTAPDGSKTIHYDWNSPNDETVLLPAIPTPPQPELPPEGDVTLELRLGDVLGQNDRNIVYAVKVTNADKIPCYVPPAWSSRSRGCSKGSIIPRCYGYFSATVDQTQMTILPWDGPDCSYPRTFDPHVPPHPSAPLSVMLLERLGDPIPTGSYLLRDHRDELARLGVTSIDWRLGNLLSAPPSPPGLPGIPSPNHDHLYSIRLFDFEFAVRANIAPRLLNSKGKVRVDNLVYDITYLPSSHRHHLASVWWREGCSP